MSHYLSWLLALLLCAGFLAAKGTTLELNTATTWGRAETLADHFGRHGVSGQ